MVCLPFSNDSVPGQNHPAAINFTHLLRLPGGRRCAESPPCAGLVQVWSAEGDLRKVKGNVQNTYDDTSNSATGELWPHLNQSMPLRSGHF